MAWLITLCCWGCPWFAWPLRLLFVLDRLASAVLAFDQIIFLR